MSTIITHRQFPGYHKYEMELAGRPLTMEVGKLAELANAAVMVGYGDTRVLTDSWDAMTRWVDFALRAAAREQIESLGAKFVDTGVSADGAGGYARELSAEEKAAQAEKLAKAVAAADVVITTAAIPGKKAPVIITRDMVGRMKYGAIIVDMAAESGGNCELTQAGEHVIANDVNIHGPLNLPSRMPTHASELYAKNLYNFLSPWIKDGNLQFDWSDEVVAGTVLCRDGTTVHATVKQVMGEL